MFRIYKEDFFTVFDETYKLGIPLNQTVYCKRACRKNGTGQTVKNFRSIYIDWKKTRGLE